MSETECRILQDLLKKWYARRSRNVTTNRMIAVEPKRYLASYNENNVNLEAYHRLNAAATRLEELGFVTVRRRVRTDHIEKIILNQENASEAKDYLQKTYGVRPDEAVVQDMQDFMEAYRGKGALTDAWCRKMDVVLAGSKIQPSFEREKDILRMLAFLETNRETIYIREASMLVYGRSKHFEDSERHLMTGVCSFLREYAGEERAENEPEDAVLERYHVENTEQEIRLCGDMDIDFGNGETIRVGGLHSGLSISSDDLDRITGIRVQAKRVMTIENKTAFQRFKPADTVTVYLGGYANRHQTAFLRKLYDLNPDPLYVHFGDIDVGGFRIYHSLCQATGIPFRLYAMGQRELEDPRFASCLQPLTETDRQNARSVLEDPAYHDTVSYMLEHNCKLEQEIVAYVLAGTENGTKLS